jgi:hypothetical protein
MAGRDQGQGCTTRQQQALEAVADGSELVANLESGLVQKNYNSRSNSKQSTTAVGSLHNKQASKQAGRQVGSL